MSASFAIRDCGWLEAECRAAGNPPPISVLVGAGLRWTRRGRELDRSFNGVSMLATAEAYGPNFRQISRAVQTWQFGEAFPQRRDGTATSTIFFGHFSRISQRQAPHPRPNTCAVRMCST